MSEEDDLRFGTEAHYVDGRLYDHVYRRRKADVRFYADLAEQHGGPVLELGVGTGRVARAIARRGVEVVGVDRMPSMLERARERLRREPRAVRDRVELRKGDLLRLRLGRRFPLIVSPFNVLNHLYERRDWERACASVARHLRRGGRFAFDVTMPDLKELSRNPDRIYRGGTLKNPSDDRRYRYAENFRYDPVRQIQWVTMSFQPVDDLQDLTITPLAHRQLFPAELEMLLWYNGFAIESRAGDFEGSELDEDSESQVVIARRRGR